MTQTDPSKIECLDKGFVYDLNDHAIVVDEELSESYGFADLEFARCARVDPLAKWRPDDGKSKQNDPKLLSYLLRNGHTTPFEHVSFTFWVRAPIFVYRQWHRHRTLSYNEESARYKKLKGDFYFPDIIKIGKQSEISHQSRILTDSIPHGDLISVYKKQLSMLKDHCFSSYRLYEYLLDNGWPREIARMVLPVNIYSEMTVSGNFWNWLRFIKLRDDEHSQYEIRVYAQAIKELLSRRAPITMRVWNELRERGEV